MIGKYHWGSDRKASIIGWERVLIELEYYTIE